VFGDAATALKNIRPGAVVALLRCRWDESGRDSIKILDAQNVREIGVSADMAVCKGVTKAGQPCMAVVNRHLHGAYCDAHLAQVRHTLLDVFEAFPRRCLLLTVLGVCNAHLARVRHVLFRGFAGYEQCEVSAMRTWHWRGTRC
jgi:Primase zinc finger